MLRTYIYAGAAAAVAALLFAGGVGLYNAGYKSAAHDYESAIRKAADAALETSRRDAEDERLRAAAAAADRSAADRLADEVIANAIRSASADCDNLDRVRLDQLDAIYSGRTSPLGVHSPLLGPATTQPPARSPAP